MGSPVLLLSLSRTFRGALLVRWPYSCLPSHLSDFVRLWIVVAVALSGACLLFVLLTVKLVL